MELPAGTAKLGSRSSTANGVALNYDTWTITLQRKQRRLSIQSGDYHAGPLVLSREELIAIARMMGLRVGSRRRKKAKAEP